MKSFWASNANNYYCLVFGYTVIFHLLLHFFTTIFLIILYYFKQISKILQTLEELMKFAVQWYTMVYQLFVFEKKENMLDGFRKYMIWIISFLLFNLINYYISIIIAFIILWLTKSN